MTILTVTAKGQVTLQRELLVHLGIQPGDKVNVDKLPDGRIEVRAAPGGHISDAFGMLHREGAPSLSLDEIDRISAEGWSSRR